MPWTIAGDMNQTNTPCLVGQTPNKLDGAFMGYITRVTLSLPKWDRVHSDYIYLDTYCPSKKKISVCRLHISQFCSDFHYAYDKDVGEHELKHIGLMVRTRDAGGERKQEAFIRMVEQYVDDYFSVSFPFVVCNY